MMSDYEKLRQENIARNQAFLESIGLADVKKSIAVINERDAAAIAAAPSSSSSSSSSYGRRGVKRTARPTSDTGDIKPQLRRSNRGSVPIKSENSFDEDIPRSGPGRALNSRRGTSELNVDHDAIQRKKVSAAQLRQYIEAANLDHAERLNDKDITHNAHRISYMSNQALATRIRMISSGTGKQSRDKMLIFYYGLCATGLPELAATALRILREWQVEGLPEPSS
jgi:hypothetical protein